jgi:hypothetical protein
MRCRASSAAALPAVGGVRPTAAALIAVGGVCALLVAGCTSEGTSSEAPPPPASAPASTPAGPTPLPMDQRVVPGDLAGMPSPAGVKVAPTKETYVDNQSDPSEAEYAEERRSDIARLADKGFVAGASKLYVDKAKGGRGLSAAAQLGSPEQAKAYEQQMYAEEFPEAPSSAAKTGTVAGASASHTIIDRTSEDGQTVSHAWASFVDGPFFYLVEAESPDPGLDGQAVIAAANDLFAKVKGAPVP